MGKDVQGLSMAGWGLLGMGLFPVAAADTELSVQLAGSVIWGRFGLGGFLPPSPPAEKATTCQYQAGKSSTGNGTRNSQGWSADTQLIDRHTL